jgi:hypothetical protein
VFEFRTQDWASVARGTRTWRVASIVKAVLVAVDIVVGYVSEELLLVSLSLFVCC